MSRNIWIAEDPTQPGTAFAMCLADDKFRADADRARAEWLDQYGVKGRLIEREAGCQMLKAWDREKSNLSKKGGAT